MATSKPPGQRATPRDRRRRLRRRVISIGSYLVIVMALAWFLESRATTTIIFVRHADIAVGTDDSDPPLSEAGRQRAEVLADFLEDIDVVASVDAIYASEFRMTQQTAAPLAERHDIEVQIEDPYDVEGFMARVMREHRGEIVLIVTQADAIAPLIQELHGSKRLEPIGPREFDKLWIVTSPRFGRVKTLEEHYTPRDWKPRPTGFPASQR